MDNITTYDMLRHMDLFLNKIEVFAKCFFGEIYRDPSATHDNDANYPCRCDIIIKHRFTAQELRETSGRRRRAPTNMKPSTLNPNYQVCLSCVLVGVPRE